MITAFLFMCLIQADSVLTLAVESSAELFRRGTSMAVMADGTVAVADIGRNSILLISRNNSVTGTVGGKGFGTDAFDLPTDVSSSFLLDLYVTDQNNRRVLRFDHRLNPVQSIDDEKSDQRFGPFQPAASAVSSQGDLYVVDQDRKRIAVFDARGQYLREFGSTGVSGRLLNDPKDIAISNNDEIFILDGRRVLRFDMFGNHLSTEEFTDGLVPVSISCGHSLLVVTAPDRIVVIPVTDGIPQIITQHSVAGAVVDPFADAVINGKECIILTHTQILRCTIR